MARAIIIHSLEQARAALAAAATLRVPAELVSAKGAAGYAGPMWFRDVVRAASAEFPQVRVTAVLDCGDAPGYALAALRAGVRAIRVSCGRTVHAKIAAIAKQYGAVLRDGNGAALDLLNENDPAAACRRWLKARKKAAG
jgi:fructose/tagatose bisphosphate aldolase